MQLLVSQPVHRERCNLSALAYLPLFFGQSVSLSLSELQPSDVIVCSSVYYATLFGASFSTIPPNTPN